ncbi:hypothetical protein KAFR_0J01030 [Kazachstania africana CBS 2517]|uniref:Protein SYS1 n=1 Tax=Kazachstania africana (strain ATCC 22294 / BCRC 22015 / CBS 2517 / CECT 1963 / NBRC 1671 / NRRL Y-8276) TaxID=1071382 RepID=H2B0M1_KAZAF|nr:hypothetical protein KAFR_0J01030 [Kazachstania africana CBS 2517]CCF60171.1 hypothetical protein KAFR_0J01030 [Kazachstania africana CBS 2517]
MLSLRRYMRIPNELRLSEIFKQDSLSPRKIFLQIVLLQLFYYTTATLLFCCWANIEGHKIEIKKWLFSFENIDITNTYGLSMCLLWLLDALICVIFLTVIVGRSKLAWDFAVTIHAINFIAVCLYTGEIPSLTWFMLQFCSSLILIFLGTWTTRWRELRDTFFEGMLDEDNVANMQLQDMDTLENGNSRVKDLESQ